MFNFKVGEWGEVGGFVGRCVFVCGWLCCSLTVFETSTQTWSHDAGSGEIADNKGQQIRSLGNVMWAAIY